MVIVTIRPGVQFEASAAAAFRRLEAAWFVLTGELVSTNSTYRSWAQQMRMHLAWQAYVAGRGPHPGHSKAVHPSESFHVSGTAFDSDLWRNHRFVALAAEHGFIRNRLHVPNEQHHFEYLRDRDQHLGQAAGGDAQPLPAFEETEEDMARNTMYATTDPKFKYRIAVCNDLSGLWVEYVTNTSTLNSKLAEQYGTGDAIDVSESMFAALRRAHHQVRPQSQLEVIVGEDTA